MTDAKFKLEDILNKQKAPPQILDLVHIKIESEEEYKNVIEKIPDYKIKAERVRPSNFPYHQMAKNRAENRYLAGNLSNFSLTYYVKKQG